MVIEILVEFLLKPVYLLLSAINPITLELPMSFLVSFEKYFANIAYVLPLDRLFPILVLSFFLHNAQIAYSMILRIKSFIPTMGA